MSKKSLKIVLIIVISILFILIGYSILNNKQKTTNSQNNINETNKEEKEPNKEEEKEPNKEEEQETLKMKLEIGNKKYDVTLYNNKTTEKLITKLPLEIMMKDLNNNEKYYYLDESLPTSPTSISTIEKGDIMLYGDNCLVIFYETFSSSYSYTRIGKIENTNNLKSDLGTSQIEVQLTK